MQEPPTFIPPLEKENCKILQLEEPTVEYYRFLYKEVGQDITWVNRLVIEREELEELIKNRSTEIFVLYHKGCPAGYAEWDKANPENIELTYFGLMPPFRGLGLGRYFLNWVIQKIWSYQPKRLWLHTCELDHQRALPMYKKAGFQVYAENRVDQLVLD